MSRLVLFGVGGWSLNMVSWAGSGEARYATGCDPHIQMVYWPRGPQFLLSWNGKFVQNQNLGERKSGWAQMWLRWAGSRGEERARGQVHMAVRGEKKQLTASQKHACTHAHTHTHTPPFARSFDYSEAAVTQGKCSPLLTRLSIPL